jgi:translation elongation factor EF-1alpha
MKVIYITLLGHKDHGKSTLIGNLLMLTKSVTQTRIKEAETYSKKLHKGFEPAFILDSFHEEREHGLTMDITRAEIAYKGIAFSFIDVPGHEELIKNMISGASYASTALLLVSAQKDEGIRDQTKRHLFIAKMMGIERLVVAINKMDVVGYSESRFNEIVKSISEFIKKIGFNLKDVGFAPVSAYRGDNLVELSKRMHWYGGAPLLEQLYRESAEPRTSTLGPLRLLVQGTLEGKERLITGRIIKGKVSAGDQVCIVPDKKPINVKGIIVKGRSVRKAKAGENVALKIGKKISGELRGSLICGAEYCPVPRDSVTAKIFITKRLGKGLSIKFNGVGVRCNRLNILRYVDPVTGVESARGTAKPLSAIVAELKLSRAIPAESFSQTRELGRFVLYSGKEFAGMGIVL